MGSSGALKIERRQTVGAAEDYRVQRPSIPVELMGGRWTRAPSG